MLCECGCGNPAPIATQTDRRVGSIKGRPRRFIIGHRSKVQWEPADAPGRYVIEDRGYLTPCHIWNGTTDELGYARFGGRVAHLVLFEGRYGPVPDGHELDHLCRQQTCVRLDHLEVVTHAENVRRGRTPKLNAEKVAVIRERFAAGETKRTIALDYGVSMSCIKSAVNRRTWADI